MSARFVGNAIASMDTLRQFKSDHWMIGQFTSRKRSVLEAFGRYAVTQVRYSLIFGLALAAQFAITLWLIIPRVAAGERLTPPVDERYRPADREATDTRWKEH